MKQVVLAVCWSLLTLVGCSRSAEVDEGCVDSAECGPGEVCDPTSRQCLATTKQTPAVEIAPPNQNNQGLVVQEILKPTRGSDGRLNIRLQTGISVEGTVYDSNATNTLIPARIVAWRDSLIQGRPQVQTETSTAIGKRDNNKDGYTLWLNKGHTYTFLVYPLAPYDYDYPPHVSKVLIDDHKKLNFALDGADRAVVVKGRVVAINSMALPPSVKIANYGNDISTALRVRAFEAKASGLRLSTVGKTNPNTGEFSIKVPGGDPTSYMVKVESAENSVPMPTLECSKIVLGIASSQQQNPQPTQKLEDPITMPAFLFPKLYTVKVQDKSGKAVLGATVTFNTELKVLVGNQAFDSCKATYQRSGLTDATGKVDLLLMPGSSTANQDYSVTVRSPTSSEAASRYLPKLEVGPNAGALAPIVLQERKRVQGTIYDQDDQPVSGVTVEASGVSSSATKVPVSSASAIADDQGSFTIYVDPGVYNIELHPPQSSGLPSSGKTVRVDSDISGTEFQVPQPHLVLGKVTSWDGKNALPQAVVRVYDLVPKTQKPVTYTATLRARSVTDAQGLFNLVLADK